MQSCRFFVIAWAFIFLVIFTACNETEKRESENLNAVDTPWEVRIKQQLEKQLKQAPEKQVLVNDSVRLACNELLHYVYSVSGNKTIWSDSGTWQPFAARMILYLENTLEAGLFKEKYHYPAITQIKYLLDRIR